MSISQNTTYNKIHQKSTKRAANYSKYEILYKHDIDQKISHQLSSPI